MMKLLTAITVLSVVFSATAYAEDYAAITPDSLRDSYTARVNQPMPRDPDLERSGYYTRQNYYVSRNPSTEQINAAIRFLGRPEHEQIGHARVLYGDRGPDSTTVTQYSNGSASVTQSWHK
jgi:hypothetical protein